jgi:hypothetical protein
MKIKIKEPAGAVWLGNERGLDERSRNPSTPPARNRSTHLATDFGVVLNWRAAAALQSSLLTPHHGLSWTTS